MDPSPDGDRERGNVRAPSSTMVRFRGFVMELVTVFRTQCIALFDAILRLDFAGRDLLEEWMKILIERSKTKVVAPPDSIILIVGAKRFRCAEVLFLPKTYELPGGNILTVDAKRFRVRKCYFINRFRCAAILFLSFRRPPSPPPSPSPPTHPPPLRGAARSRTLQEGSEGVSGWR